MAAVFKPQFLAKKNYNETNTLLREATGEPTGEKLKIQNLECNNNYSYVTNKFYALILCLF